MSGQASIYIAALRETSLNNFAKIDASSARFTQDQLRIWLDLLGDGNIASLPGLSASAAAYAAKIVADDIISGFYILKQPQSYWEGFMKPAHVTALYEYGMATLNQPRKLFNDGEVQFVMQTPPAHGPHPPNPSYSVFSGGGDAASREFTEGIFKGFQQLQAQQQQVHEASTKEIIWTGPSCRRLSTLMVINYQFILLKHGCAKWRTVGKS